jgi:hypothetical protein
MPRPPQLPDAQIRAVIDELRAGRAQPTGTELRAELARRFGHRGGVSRIYRLLRESAQVARPPSPMTVPSPYPTEPDDLTRLREELRLATERAELAELREESHLNRWANEIHELREQAQTYRAAAQRLPLLERELQDRSRELAAAYHRISEIEAQLLRLQKD